MIETPMLSFQSFESLQSMCRAVGKPIHDAKAPVTDILLLTSTSPKGAQTSSGGSNSLQGSVRLDELTDIPATALCSPSFRHTAGWQA